ncbi:MAG: T9SS type A sorting domain-containing protein [Flavobacteriales bacterium]|nr:T9SS type A sorting domain-containing protein [Bacteroidota bacterium]MCB9241052.1 T9SS type A sorting domain-containing protein [Flavobacteriales bacterium]
MKKFISTTIVVILCSSVFAQIPSKGLVGFWQFNGNANDSSGYRNHGLVNGASLTADRFGQPNQAFYFDGIDDYINVGHSSSLMSSDHTVTFWFRFSDTSRTMHMVSNFTSYEGEFGSAAVHNKDVGLQYNVGSGKSEKNMLHQGFTRLADNRWHMFTAMYNVKNNSMVMYLDCDLAGGVNYVAPKGHFQPNEEVTFKKDMDWIFGAASQYFGSRVNNGPLWYRGYLDDVRMYNRPLSTIEVLRLYHNGVPDCRCDGSGYDTTNYFTGGGNQSIIIDTSYVTIGVTDTLFINLNKSAGNFDEVKMAKVYPNPTNDFINVEFGDLLQHDGLSVKIYNIAGQTIFDDQASEHIMKIYLSQLGAKGVYALHVVDSNGKIVSIKQIVLQ